MTHTLPPITVYIVDDHMAVISGLKSYLEGLTGFTILGHATDGSEAVRGIEATHPKVVVLDIFLPQSSGIEIVTKLQEKGTSARIVVYTMSVDKNHIIEMFRAGVYGYVLKEEPLVNLAEAIRTTAMGCRYYSKTVKDVLSDHLVGLEQSQDSGMIASLSRREIEVLPLLADGKSIREISDILNISTKTVESHKYHIMDKLNVSSITQLTKIAIRNKMIEL